MLALVLSGGLAEAHSSDDRTQALERRVEELEGRLKRIESPPEVPPHPGVGDDVVVPMEAHWSEAVAWRGDLRVDGAVSGPVVAVGGDVVVGPEARVEGHIISLGGEINVHPDAVVHGDRVGLSPPERGDSWLAALARRVSTMLGMAAFAVFVTSLFPERSRNIADTLRQGAGWYTVAGAILGAGAMVGTVAAVLSVIAAPLAIVLGVGVAFAWLVGAAGVSRWIGESLPGPERPPWVSALAGAMVFGLVASLPTIGPVVGAVGALAAVGAGSVSWFGKRAVLDA